MDPMNVYNIIQLENAINDSESDSTNENLLLDLHSRQIIWGDVNEDDLCQFEIPKI